MTNPQEHAGLNRQIHPPSSWLFLVLFLSFGFYISFNLQFILIIDFTLFLPLLVGWLANRYGLSLAPLVLVIGFVCTLNVGIHFMVYETIETIDMIGTATGWIYVLSLGCAIAFSR
jgi:hypothetical protein